MNVGLTILILAKAPQPGKAKTRLIPRYGIEGAAALAAAALQDTLDVVAKAHVYRRFLVLEGKLDLPVPTGISVMQQTAGSLDMRIAAALAAIDGPALLIGMDTPQIDCEMLDIDLLDRRKDAWFGPAEDGGWWALGLRTPARDALEVCLGIPMSTAETGKHQRERLGSVGLSYGILPTLRDVDQPGDAELVARLAPMTRFARVLRSLSGCSLPENADRAGESA